MRNSRWNKTQDEILVQTVGRSATATKGIRTAARKLKRTAGGCAQRYYLLQRKAQSPVNKKMASIPHSLGYSIPVKGKIKAITFTGKSINLIFS